MNWGWLLLLVAISGFSDWPWLIAVAGLSWVLSLGHWPASPSVLVAEIIGVTAVEGILAALRPAQRLEIQARGVGLQGAALGGLALLGGLWTGLLLWQVALGADAIHRGGLLFTNWRRTAYLRLVRIVVELTFLILYSHGL